MNTERRIENRIKTKISVRTRILESGHTGKPYVHDAYVIDISRRGARILTLDLDDASFEMLGSPEKTICITLTPPLSLIARSFCARIMWINYENTIHDPVAFYGIQFDNLSEKDKCILDECLKHYEKQRRHDDLSNN